MDRRYELTVHGELAEDYRVDVDLEFPHEMTQVVQLSLMSERIDGSLSMPLWQSVTGM